MTKTILVLAALCTRPINAQAVSKWTIGTTPLVTIGGDGNDTLILGAESAVRLSNGDIVVGSSKNSRVQWFDARGKLVRTVGRRGQGPGEFGRSIYLYVVAGDTVVARDETNRRYHHIAPTGMVVRTDTLGDARRPLWLYDRFLIERVPAAVSFQALRSTLARIPFRDADTISLARVTTDGFVWVRTNPTATTYNVFSPRGGLTATVELPPRFEPYEILDTLVLGKWLDEDDIEHVQLRRLVRGGAANAAGSAGRPEYAQDAELLAQAPLIARMRAGTRNALTANEAFFADHKRYAKNIEELGANGIAISPDIKLTMFWASANSYSLLAQHASTRIICVVVLVKDFYGSFRAVCG